MVILQRRNFKLSDIRVYLKKNYLMSYRKKLRLIRLSSLRLKKKLLARYVLVLADKNSRGYRSYERSIAWRKANVEKIRRAQVWRAKRRAYLLKKRQTKRYKKALKKRKIRFWTKVLITRKIKRRILKNKSLVYLKGSRKLFFLKNSVYGFFLFTNYRQRMFYSKFIIPRFRFRVFRRHLRAVFRRLDRRFRVIKPINFKMLKFIGDYYILYDLRFYYHRLRFLKMLAWQKRFSKRRKMKPITRFYKLHLINYFINNLIRKGNKKKAYNIFFNLLLLLKYQHKFAFLKILYSAVSNVKPLISFVTMYIGGKKYRIPILLSHNKGYKLGLKWIVSASVLSSKSDLIINLMRTFLECYSNEGDVIKKRKEYHLSGFDNKSYIRFLRFLKK